MFSSPTVVGDLLFVGSCSGNFYAMDPETGRVRWSYNIKQDGNQTSFHGDPLVTGDLILIGTDAGKQGHIYAFERATGNVRWKYLAPAGAGGDVGVASDIVRRGNYVYAIAHGDELLCLNLDDGRLHWSFASNFDRKEFAWSNSPLLEGNVILFAGLDGQVYALNAESGKVVWKTDLHSPASTTPIVLRGTAYVGTQDGHFYQLGLKNGSVISSIALTGSPGRHLTIVGNSLLAFVAHSPEETGGNPLQVSDLVSMDLSLKHVQWRQKSPEARDPWSSARPYVWNDNALAGDEHGKLFAFHQSDGSVAWSYQFPSQVIRGIGVAKDTLYVGTIHGMVYAFVPPRDF